MIRNEKRWRICTCLLILNLCFIWGNSLLPGSVSAGLSDWVKELLAMLLPGEGMESAGGGLLRKLAHFTEFAALGALLAWRTAMAGRKAPRALLWGGLAACLDETIQMFVPDRGPSLFDVGIDTCGVLTGILLLHFGHLLWMRKLPTPSGGKNL